MPERSTAARHAAAFGVALFLATAAPAQEGRASRPASSPATATAPASAAEKVLDQVVVIGASLSDGVVSGLSIARMLDLAIRTPHQRVSQVTSGAFFSGPVRIGKVQLDRALRQEPTLLVGVDFLFWYAYGYLDGVFVSAGHGQLHKRVPAAQEAAIRGRLLAKGLQELERFAGHIVVGDLPDMSDADPIMLDPMQVPTAEVRDRLNETIRAWARNRGRVLVLPVSQWVTDMKVGKMDLEAGAGAAAIGGSPAAPPALVLTADQVLQRDRLHPTGIGIVALCTRICAELRSWLGESADLRLDARSILDEKGLLERITGPANGGK